MADLKQVLGAMIFGANCPLSVKEMRKCLKEVAEDGGAEARAFAKTTEGDIRQALSELDGDLRAKRHGFYLVEVAGGFRFQTDSSCGQWLKHLLNIGRPNRLSRPALETLAIVAYRQPVTRSEIETVRGVAADHVVRSLLEMQLIRIVGRSELPGRPFLYGTTHLFLDHFGLKDLDELRQMEPMLLAEREEARNAQRRAEQATSSQDEEGDEDRDGDRDEDRDGDRDEDRDGDRDGSDQAEDYDSEPGRPETED
ncbi:SMC-Scp complex subunit ScpB [Verrucomicrobiota bacterium]